MDDDSEYVEEEEDMECEVFGDDQGYNNPYQTAYYDYIVETDDDDDINVGDYNLSQ